LPRIDHLKAATSSAGLAVSGWDVARKGPRATRFAVPAGAVYFFEGSGPADGFLGGSDDEKAEGWGFALPGIWEDKNA
jgi:CRISPR-associated protein Cmr3